MQFQNVYSCSLHHSALYDVNKVGESVQYNRPNHLRLCFVLVPLRGKVILDPCPQKKVLVPFRGFSHNV